MRLARCALRAPEPQPRVWASPHSYLAGGDRPDQQALPPRGRRPHIAEDGVGARRRLRCELCRASVHPVPPPTLVRRVHVLRATLNNGAHTVACAGAAGLAVVIDGMNRVVNGVRGTARGARIDEPGLAMAGKTGTSQVRRITTSERASGVLKNAERPWKERDHALFVAFAPVEAPRYAVAVVVEHGGSGSRAAAPVARDILRETQRRDPLRPATPDTAARRRAAPKSLLRTPWLN